MAKTTTTKDDALSTLKAAVAAARTLTSAEAELRAQHSATLAERRGVVAAYASEAECLANLNRLVDEKAIEWAKTHGVAFVRSLSGGKELRGDSSTVEREVAPRLPSWGELDGRLSFQDWVGLCPEDAKRRLTEVVRSSAARFGLPSEQRAARLAELDAAIAELEASHSALVEGAASVGIALPLLDSVRQRHEAEAATEERAARLVADRERGVFAVSGASIGGGRA